jgi:cytochrome c peroxidase
MWRFVLALSLVCGASAQTVVPAPTGLDASDGAYTTRVGLAWEHIQGAKTYRVYRAETNDSAQAKLVGTTPSILYFDRTAVPGPRYFYWTQAVSTLGESALSASDEGFVAAGKTSAFGPIGPPQPPPEPPENPLTGPKIYLGKALFWDEQLSSTRTVACGTCHRPRKGGSDPRAIVGSNQSRNPGPDTVFGTADDVFGSPGVPLNKADGTYEWSPFYGFREQVTPRKAQTVFEAAFTDLGLLWDGRALNRFVDPLTDQTVMQTGGALESQSLLPILNETEMSHKGRTWADVVARLEASRPLALSPALPRALSDWIGGRSYGELFQEAFGTPEITPVRIAFAIASYERTLFSDRARIDRYAAEIEPMPEDEARGKALFFGNFCDECHRGNLIGDNRFRYIGVRPDAEDAGRFEVTRDSRDLGRMRTQSLRNVALRGPFMHTGSLATLSEVVEFYNRGGDFTSPNKDSNFVKPLKLTTQEKADLLAFLERSLTDERLAAEQGPLFDRPALYTESARVPAVEPAGSGIQVTVLEPPLLGNPSFTVAVSGATGGEQATLVVDDADPGAGPSIPATGELFWGQTTAGGSAESRHASISVPIPNDTRLAGRTFFGRWYLRREGGGLTVSPVFRLTIFGPAKTTTDPSLPPLLSSVSAASFVVGRVSPESLVSGFGPNLSLTTEAATSLPLPVALGGVSILVRDSAGAERAAPLLFVSAGQINYQIPGGTAPGEATVLVRWNGSTVARGSLQVATVAPALFAANASGTGLAAAQAVRAAADGSQTIAAVAEYDTAAGRYLARPIDVSGQGAVLVLYGVGVRFASGVTATIGGEPAEVLFAGRQSQFAGVDQVNVRLSPGLAGRGEVEVVLQADGESSNPVRIRIQ